MEKLEEFFKNRFIIVGYDDSWYYNDFAVQRV